MHTKALLNQVLTYCWIFWNQRNQIELSTEPDFPFVGLVLDGRSFKSWEVDSVKAFSETLEI